MRTTLTIDDDVPAAAKRLAARQNKCVGEVISALSRQALNPAITQRQIRNGVPLLVVRAGAAPMTQPLVSHLCDAPP